MEKRTGRRERGENEGGEKEGAEGRERQRGRKGEYGIHTVRMGSEEECVFIQVIEDGPFYLSQMSLLCLSVSLSLVLSFSRT